MAQRPFQAGAVVNLSDGESIKEAVLVNVSPERSDSILNTWASMVSGTRANPFSTPFT